MATQTTLSNADGDRQSTLETVVREAVALTGADGASIELAEGDDLVCRAAAGSVLVDLDRHRPLQGSLSGLCVRHGKALRCDDSEIDLQVDRSAYRALGIGSMVVAPLVSRNATVGVLEVQAGASDRFGDEAVEVLSMLAGVVAGALDRVDDTTDGLHSAGHDALTGLANRKLLHAELSRCLHQLRSMASDGIAVVFVDIDGFDEINGSVGRTGGDAVLVTVAERLRSVVRSEDLVARAGGDEFVVAAVLQHRGDPATDRGPSASTPDLRSQAAELADRLSEALVDPVPVGHRTVTLRVRTGAATTDDPDETAQTLIARAEAARPSVAGPPPTSLAASARRSGRRRLHARGAVPGNS